MFSKYSKDDNLTNEIVKEMDSFLKSEYGEKRVVKTASAKEDDFSSILKSVANEIQKCASLFESLGHDLAGDAREAFDFVNDEIKSFAKKNVNPYAVCTDSVGREDEEKFERCVKKVKKVKASFLKKHKDSYEGR